MFFNITGKVLNLVLDYLTLSFQPQPFSHLNLEPDSQVSLQLLKYFL